MNIESLGFVKMMWDNRPIWVRHTGTDLFIIGMDISSVVSYRRFKEDWKNSGFYMHGLAYRWLEQNGRLPNFWNGQRWYTPRLDLMYTYRKGMLEPDNKDEQTLDVDDVFFMSAYDWELVVE